MPKYAIQISLSTQCCIRCGVLFGMDVGFEFELRRSGKIFYCPNGHRQCYDPDKDSAAVERKESESIKERRRELMKEIHEADQAAAKAVEAAVGKPAVMPGDEIECDAAAHSTRFKCPNCGKTYRFWSGVRKHLRDIHGYTPEKVREIEANARQIAEGGAS
jgi:predicted RNA-binding Zn-ribbon protein involved in translation (DUF1610 family)